MSGGVWAAASAAALVVVFDQYEIAPGSEGRPEFEIAAGEQKPASGYEDNFSVPAEDAAAFAKQVKEAVAGRDLEKLANLSAFPMYIGLEVGKTVESKEQFAALGADAVFTEGVMKSVAAADENSLSASKAGFVLSDGGSANVIFGVRDGKLAVEGQGENGFEEAVCRIPLCRGSEPVARKYCLFWKKDNSGYYVEEFAEMLKMKF